MTSARSIVLHVVSGDADNLVGAITVAGRIADVQTERGVRVEVFIFAAAQRALTDPRRTAFNEGVDALIARGVPVSACSNFAAKLHANDHLRNRGIVLEPARATPSSATPSPGPP